MIKDVSVCRDNAQKGRAFCSGNNCIIPDAVGRKLYSNGLIELSVYGGKRCGEGCMLPVKCWVLPKSVHQDVKEAIASIA